MTGFSTVNLLEIEDSTGDVPPEWRLDSGAST